MYAHFKPFLISILFCFKYQDTYLTFSLLLHPSLLPCFPGSLSVLRSFPLFSTHCAECSATSLSLGGLKASEAETSASALSKQGKCLHASSTVLYILVVLQRTLHRGTFSLGLHNFHFLQSCQWDVAVLITLCWFFFFLLRKIFGLSVEWEFNRLNSFLFFTQLVKPSQPNVFISPHSKVAVLMKHE